MNLSSPFLKINAIALLWLPQLLCIAAVLKVFIQWEFSMTTLSFLIPRAFSLGKPRSKCLNEDDSVLISFNGKAVAALWMGSCIMPVRCVSGSGAAALCFPPSRNIGDFGESLVHPFLPRSPAEGTRAPHISPVHLLLVIDGLISSLCERKQISSNLQQ